ncbi:MAG: DegT/DnrJ/EryC1/StrS family aminotransferase [Hyphomicrobiales bacterium]|nr:DegT/DnrJ/EryC1/StrS family aminotransferase [Hyphomicrobiales bacterium]
MNPFAVVRDFEKALAEYCGAPDAVATTSCTMALLMALAWFLEQRGAGEVTIPKLTYVGVGMSVLNSGHRIAFRDEDWRGEYQCAPLPLWDSARRLTSGMYRAGAMQCLSFHWTKHLSIGQGGAVLLDDPEAAAWLKRARFDGRTEGVAPKDDVFDMIGWHAYLMPRDAAEGLTRLALLPRHNDDLPWSDYPDLSQAPVFR